jgi:hypothetical protein
MHGVILGINLYDYKTELSKGDLVTIDDGFEDYTILRKIDKRHGKRLDEPDTPFMYFVRSKSSNVLMNYARNELSKASIGFFDYEAYYNHNKKILLGAIWNDDMNHIKGKFAVEYDVPFSDFHKIKLDDIIGLDFEGTITTKKLDYQVNENSKVIKTELKYFKIDIPK